MMPWETPPVQDASLKTFSLEIPAFLKRDANNIAPYMRSSRADNLRHLIPNWLPLSESKT